ncbi:MAG: ATP-dependent helicase HrpB [Xanthobacteraceae bacterium]|nr:MAG: ATP-dependent helicase HrpB [Xanthobacteraceae bacterium]
MRSFDSPLPIDEVLAPLARALIARNAAVLVAPPGAGKTTRVPLALIDEPWVGGRRIIVLEPRRLAARAAAERMAKTLGERVGETVGYRVRFGSKVSRATRIEVVTEGIFTRQILDDPELTGVAAVLFDEFHERSLAADLGLALARDAQGALREDLRLLVMSATLDGARVARLLADAPVIESAGRAYPVDTRYVGRKPDAPLERQMADTIAVALRAQAGSVLAFLPGAAEIRRTQTLLAERVSDPAVDIVALFGALEQGVQDRALMPSPPGRRKVVLATSIAETSLTIEGVRVVVDSGVARVPRYEPDVGLTRLETVRASRAAVDQRRGRAGRTEPGVCYRLWDEPQTLAFEPFTRPEILAADLGSLMLDCAQWGVTDPATLAFLDAPPAPALTEARALLRELGAIDGDGRITAEGRALRALPLPPRLARMIVDAAREGEARRAAEIAVVLAERGLGGDGSDLETRLDQLGRDRSQRASAARAMAARWAAQAGRGSSSQHQGEPPSIGSILALAYPDRVARNRGGGGFVLANGRGATVDAAAALAREPFIVVAELTGTAASGRVLLAAPLSLADIEARFSDRIETRDDIVFDRAALALRARRRRVLGALVLSEVPLAIEPDAATARILADGIVGVGLARLPWSKALTQWRDRVMFLRAAEGDEWPDLSDAGLIAARDDWLMPLAAGRTALAQIPAGDMAEAMMALLPWPLRRRLDHEAPTHFEAPTGTAVPIDYQAEEGPKIAVRVQELFGLARHPAIAKGRVPLVIELLSPAHRPVQVTRDLPGFWHGSYAAVRTEMRGRYPRHPWPDDPANAAPTRRAKPRGQ